jgi:predicted outer membrane protein
MKLPVLSTLCLVATASVVLAQAPAPNPPGTPAAPGAAPATGAATTTADKPTPLTSNDKAFLKKVLEGMYFELKLTDKHKTDSAKLEDTKKVAQKMNTDLNKIWGELAGLVDTKEIPNELAGGDKSKADRIAKAGDKYDKELLETLEKETKQIEKAFESASKSSQHPTIKTVTSNWLPTIKGHGDEIDKAAKVAAKQK